MFFRVSIATVLIWAGVAAPWLARDWLEWREDEATADRLYEAAVAFPERVRSSFQKKEPELQSEQTEATRLEPYPLASNTWRVLQGFLPSRLAVPSESSLPVFGLASTPSTSHSRAVVDATSQKLESRLASLDLSLGDPVFLRVFKEERELEVWMKAEKEPHFTLFRVYRIRDISGKSGPKLREGDRQAPEGFYYVGASRLRPDTRHHLAIDLGFPNNFDRAKERTGSDIMIRAGGGSSGSFVLSEADINEVYTLAEAALREGQAFFRIHCFPFRMTDQRMEREWKRQPKWISFWVNLKEGYDFFENVNFPPDASFADGKYRYRIP